MRPKPLRNIVVVGTDTDVGKTVFCAWLMSCLPYRYWKPIQSGSCIADDTQVIENISSPIKKRCIEPFIRLKNPLSPHLAADEEGVCIDPLSIKLPHSHYESCLMEGVGGLMTPLNHQMTFYDWISLIDWPVVIVAKDHLGTINHTCLTVLALQQRNIPIVGVILNATPSCMPDVRHKQAIESFSRFPVLMTLPCFQDISQSSFQKVPCSPKLLEALTFL